MNRDFTHSEIKALFKTLKDHRADVLARRDLAVYQFLNETGLRINEFAQTTQGDARRWLKSGRLYIPAERRKGVAAGKILRDAQGQPILNAKGRPRRAIVREDLFGILNNIAAAALRELLVIGGQQDDDAPLVMSRTGAPLSVRSYQARLSEWAAKAGLPSWASPHCFRHTVALRTRRDTIAPDPFLQVAHKLGQSARASAMLYAKPSREELEAEAERLEGQRGGPRQSKRDFMRGVKK